MEDLIQFDTDLMIKVLEAYFNKLTEIKGFFRTGLYWTIDSKFRTSKSVDKFLKDQLINPHPDLIALANKLRGKSIDDTMNNILKYVNDVVKYESDSINYGIEEYWATAEEVLTKKVDDCDGQNSLIYILARLAGVPSYVLFSILGDTKSGGHYWCVYWSVIQHKLVSIDSTFYPDFTPIKDREEFKTSMFKYHDIWAIFNETGIWRIRYG